MLEINSPDVIAEVTACCEAYERALVANDVDALRDFFWDSPHAIRFGVAEELYGAAEISEFRKNRVIDFTDRTTEQLTVLALGRDVAVAMLQFENRVHGRLRRGRQTQIWARFPGEGWRVTSAHVSRPIQTGADPIVEYVDAAAAAIGLPIAEEQRPGTIASLRTSAAIAGPLMAFPLPAGVEIAPVFEP